MEQAMLWVTIFGIIVIPLVGWIFNTLITNKIDAGNIKIEAQEKSLEAAKKEYYADLNGFRKAIEDGYVRKDLYEQAMKFHSDKNDAEFKSLLAVVNTQFGNMEDKYQNMDEKIDEIKELINEKLNQK